MGFLHNFTHNIRRNLKANPRIFLLYSTLRVLIILVLIRHLLAQDYEAVCTCVLALILFLVPSCMENSLKVKIPPLFETLIYLFIFSAEILGEVNHFYTAIPEWDIVLHTLNGFLAAAVGFSLIDLLNRSKRDISLSPAYLALMAFCFSMTIGVIWEFFEFTMDFNFGHDMQKDTILKAFHSVTLDPTNSQHVQHIADISHTEIIHKDGTITSVPGGYLDIGLVDTMDDLFVNFIGALTFSFIGYIYVKSRGNRSLMASRIASDLLVRSISDDPRPLMDDEAPALAAKPDVGTRPASKKGESADQSIDQPPHATS